MSQTDIYKRALKLEDDKSRLVLNEFLHLVQEFDSISRKATLKDLLDHLEMMSEFDIEIKQDESKEDSIIVTTIHQSKGREFPIVFVVDVADKRLPVSFKEKKFYCPSELSHSERSKEFTERELFTQEERRLLYVAMTRAQHQLYLSRAEVYGENTTKTKPSQFLLELALPTNGFVDSVQHAIEADMPLVAATDSRVDHLKHEYQALISKFIEQMQLSSAIEKLVELAIIAHYQAGKPLADFSVEEVFPRSFFEQPAVGSHVKAIEAQLRDEKPSLIDADRIHFSASALKTYEECPLKYKFFYVLDVPTPSKSYFDLGTAVHSVVEALTRRQIEEEGYMPTLKDALALLDNYWVHNSYHSVTQEEEDHKAAEGMLQYFVNWCVERNQLGCTPFAAEKDFEIAIANGKRLKGFIDRIDVTPSGEYEVFDYKTGKSMLTGNTIKKDIQMNAYSLAVKSLYGKLPVTANLLYVRKERPIVYEVTNESVKQVEQEVTALVNGVLGGQFDPTPSLHTCKFCDYKSICDAKEIEGDE